jgi:hypothetical protein
MREEEAKAKILEQVSITRQKVTIAKANLIKLLESHSDTNYLIKALLKSLYVQMPEKIIINPAVDPLPSLTKAAEAISWQVAASEAIWELIHDNLIIPSTSSLSDNSIHISWTTVYNRSGGTSSGWSFNEYATPIPSKISLPHSRKTSSEFLVNPDLYLHDLRVPNLHSEIELALREAVKCFRYELFTASATMLGKASEGAWLELGSALIQALPSNNIASVKKQKEELENPVFGVGKKIATVITLYERQDLFSPVTERSGISVRELRTAANWSDTIRDSRNTIHFGVEPSIPNSYEKVAALLLGAVPYLRMIYQVKAACDSEDSE